MEMPDVKNRNQIVPAELMIALLTIALLTMALLIYSTMNSAMMMTQMMMIMNLSFTIILRANLTLCFAENLTVPIILLFLRSI
jgi:hypothetical protein